MKLDRGRLQRAREMLGYGLEKTAEEAGISKNSVLRAEHEEDIRPVTARKIAAALGVPVADLIGESEVHPKAVMPSSLPTLNGALEEEKHAVWEAAVENARGLRESGQTRMTELLSLWRASRERQEDADARREYRNEMADLLIQAHKAKTDLFRNITFSSPAARRAKEEARKAGAREVPNADWEEFLEADRFYYRLHGMLEGFELTVLTGDAAAAAAAAEQATADEATAEHVQSETMPHRVEEPIAA